MVITATPYRQTASESTVYSRAYSQSNPNQFLNASTAQSYVKGHSPSGSPVTPSKSVSGSLTSRARPLRTSTPVPTPALTIPNPKKKPTSRMPGFSPPNDPAKALAREYKGDFRREHKGDLPRIGPAKMSPPQSEHADLLVNGHAPTTQKVRRAGSAGIRATATAAEKEAKASSVPPPMSLPPPTTYASVSKAERTATAIGMLKPLTHRGGEKLSPPLPAENAANAKHVDEIAKKAHSLELLSQNEKITAARFAELKAKGGEEYASFMKELPKGADLHSHLQGEVYFKAWLDQAIKYKLYFDPKTYTFTHELPPPRPPSSAPPKDEPVFVTTIW